MIKNKFIQNTMIMLCGVFFIASTTFESGFALNSFHKKLTFNPQDAGLKVNATAYTEKESKSLLSNNLLSKGYRPVEVTIVNNSGNEYSLCESSVDLRLTSIKEIIHKVKKGAFPRRIAYSVFGFFFWPVIFPSMIDGALTHRGHRSLEKDYESKVLRKDIIKAYSALTRVFFVKEEDFKEAFAMTVIDLETLKPTVLNISLTGSLQEA